MAQGKIRAEIDGPLQLDDGLVMVPAQPERPTHGPMRGGVAVIGHEALPGGLERPVDFRLAPCPALKGVLEVRER